MKDKESWEMNKEEEHLSEVLQNIGYHKNVAKLMVYFFCFKEGMSADIEHVMFMRQPEVSIAINELVDKNCLHCEKIQTNLKGRPKFRYTRIKSRQEMIKFVEDEIKEIMKKQQALLDELKDSVTKVNGD